MAEIVKLARAENRPPDDLQPLAAIKAAVMDMKLNRSGNE